MGATLKIAYFDCFSGISGDMCLGALVDAGMPLKKIEEGLKKLPVTGYKLSARKVKRSCVSCTKVDVQIGKGKGQRKEGRRWEDIERIINKSSLSDDIKQQGLGIFRRLFKAEAEVHGETFNSVHLHELGAVDCLADIFGTLIGLELFGVEAVYSSPVNLGGGYVNTAHGMLPVPAPATVAMLKGVPVYSSCTPFELTTPTGAAILKSSSSGFGEMPLFVPERTGIGAGSRDIKNRPNVLRIFIGDVYKETSHDAVTVIETNIDDMNPQVYGYLVDMLFKKGALDVFMTQTVMKKMRPGVKLSVLCNEAVRNDLMHLILRETTSIGVRYYEASRVRMERSSRHVSTKHGKVGIKVSSLGGFEKCSPEYEDCKSIARKSGVPLLQVIDEAKRAAAVEIKKKK
jgi:uncharacterized protein (TIGR00299 family) protein